MAISRARRPSSFIKYRQTFFFTSRCCVGCVLQSYRWQEHILAFRYPLLLSRRTSFNDRIHILRTPLCRFVSNALAKFNTNGLNSFLIIVIFHTSMRYLSSDTPVAAPSCLLAHVHCPEWNEQQFIIWTVSVYAIRLNCTCLKSYYLRSATHRNN